MSKILLFSDIHFGEQLNSPLKLDIAISNINWIINILKTYNINKIIFCGDWFHSRNSISVNTFYQSYLALEKLCQHVNKMYMIIGNHDSYFKNTITVHSLKSFEQISNLEIIDSPKYIKYSEKLLGLIPWSGDFTKNKCDYLFGHFEPNGAQHCGVTFQGGKYDISILNEYAPCVFSGHFHLNKEYITEKGKVIMIGSPSQQNWGDTLTDRGCYILDVSSGEYQFIKNSIAPIHKKILYSEILTSKKLPSKSELNNNFIKIIIDCPYKYLQIQKLIKTLEKAQPLTIETEYYYSDQVKLNLNGMNNDYKLKTHEDYIIEYLDSLFKTNSEQMKNLDNDKLKSLALNIFHKVASEE